MDKNNEFKKLLSEMEISVDDILNEKSLYDNTSQKKEFTPVSIKQEELEDEMHDNVLEFKNQGVQQGILNKLKRIKRDYDFKEGRIDLHGENIQTAQLKINNHLKKCFNNNIRYLLIITGKGASQKISPLKKLVFVMLRKYSIVNAFCSANNHGGSGAFYVQIKN